MRPVRGPAHNFPEILTRIMREHLSICRTDEPREKFAPYQLGVLAVLKDESLARLAHVDIHLFNILHTNILQGSCSGTHIGDRIRYGILSLTIYNELISNYHIEGMIQKLFQF
jgi:hypothetical protein